MQIYLRPEFSPSCNARWTIGKTGLEAIKLSLVQVLVLDILLPPEFLCSRWDFLSEVELKKLKTTSIHLPQDQTNVLNATCWLVLLVSTPTFTSWICVFPTFSVFVKSNQFFHFHNDCEFFPSRIDYITEILQSFESI